MMAMPMFFKSGFYDKTTGKLKPNAPKEVVDSYNKYKKIVRVNKNKGISV